MDQVESCLLNQGTMSFGKKKDREKEKDQSLGKKERERERRSKIFKDKRYQNIQKERERLGNREISIRIIKENEREKS